MAVSVTFNDVAITSLDSGHNPYYTGPDLTVTETDSVLTSFDTAPAPSTVATLNVTHYDVAWTYYDVDTLGLVTVSVQMGNTITPNKGLIFVENTLTNGMTDYQLGFSVGLSFTVIAAIRRGIPYWPFYAVITKFGGIYGIDPNRIRANFRALTSKLGKSSPTKFQSLSQSFGSYYGLRSKPTTFDTFLAEPYTYTWSHPSVFASAPVSSSALDATGLWPDNGAFYTHLWVTGGRVLATLDGRYVEPSSYDYALGAPSGASSGGSGAAPVIDEFDTQYTAMSLAEEEYGAFFGFSRPSGTIGGSTAVYYYMFRVAPGDIRVVAQDSSAQIRYSFEKVGDSWDGNL